MADTTDSGSLPETSKTAPPSAPHPDESFYTWRNFFSIMAGTATDEERRQYLLVRDIQKEESDCKRCEDHRDYLLKYSPIIRFLTSEISALGPPINSTNIRCRRCTTRQSGGFDASHGILLCANGLRNRGHAEDTLAHELVHAYDHLRFKVSPTDLRHQACTEIRASTLSGECRFGREFWTRGQWRLTGQLQECVRRRAALSLSARPGVKDLEHAGRVVDEVWDSCFNDTRPFDEIYR